jgi:DNA-binding NtrC family response regulator
MHAQVIIWDPAPGSGCGGNCRRIGTIAGQALGSEKVQITTLNRLENRKLARPDLAVVRVPARDSLGDLVQKLKGVWHSVPVLAAVCDASGRTRELLDSFRHGLDDFFCCPFPEHDFAVRLQRWLPERAKLEERASLRNLRLDALVGESPALLAAIQRIPHAAESAATVLIGGETGAGKELFARAVHYNGARKSRPFIPVNCSSLPDHLFENELFGHARGAYTDARSSERGLLAEAEGGTLFLDEVDMLAPSAQAKLLRFLQDREYRPLGSAKALVADVRTVAATNGNLRELVAARQFREDLFHRLNILYLHVPSLRERTSDIPLLADHFLTRFAAQYNKAPIRLSSGALHKLLAYSWPGNVRELEGMLHRAVVFTSSGVLEAADIELPLQAAALSAPQVTSKGRAMEEFERGYLSSLLAEHHGNVSHAARAASLDRRTFQRLLKKHAIERVSFKLPD